MVDRAYLFIPHSPLQFEVFELWAEVVAKETNMKAICLLITEDLRFRVSENHTYSEVVSLDELTSKSKSMTFDNKIGFLKLFEVEHSTCLISVDWSIDRAFQNYDFTHEDGVSFTTTIIEKVAQLIEKYNVVGAMSEKLFLPQRIVHHILVKKGLMHVLPIGDRFFSRFYFESGLNEWYWEKILKAYKKNREISIDDVPHEVKEVYDKVIFKKYKKVLADSKDKKKKTVPSLAQKLMSRMRKPQYTNVYSEYLFGDFKRSLLNKLHTRRIKKQNRSDYESIVTKEVPKSKFVLFLFHMQPEYTVDGIAMNYYNQVEFVSNIARSLPADISIVVKENPKTVGGLHRPKSYYKDLVRHPNITFLHHNVDAHELIMKSIAVITLTGTVGIEALMMDKPVIVVGNIFYRYFDRVYFVATVGEVLETIEFIKSGGYNSFASEDEKKLFGLKVLKSFYDATFIGQLYNGASPDIHRSPENLALLKVGFRSMLKDYELLEN